VRDEIQSYRDHDVRPFGVNPASAERHAAYAAKLALPFPLLSDPEHAISRAYGSLKPLLLPGIARSVCLIDRDGTVLYSQSGAPGAAIILESLERE
jgi:thioredoxin-dependent peroxiredoxin